jgi:hypothetical protein
MTYGKVAEVGRYLLVQQGNAGGERHDICIYNKETGEYLDKLTQEQGQEVFYQNNINHEIGIVLASITSDNLDSKNRQVEVWDGVPSSGQKSTMRAIGNMKNIDEEIGIVLPYEEGKKQVSYSLISRRGKKIELIKYEIVKDKKEAVKSTEWHTNAVRIMAFLIMETGVYVMSKGIHTEWESMNAVFRISEKNLWTGTMGKEGDWVNEEWIEKIYDSVKIADVHNNGELYKEGWYTKVEFV